MSLYVKSRKCDLCGKNNIPMMEMTVGKTNHYLCYPCMYDFGKDVGRFVSENFTEEQIRNIKKVQN